MCYTGCNTGDRGTQTSGGILTIRSEMRTSGRLPGKELAGAVEVVVADAIAITNLSSEGVRGSAISRSSGPAYIQEGPEPYRKDRK